MTYEMTSSARIQWTPLWGVCMAISGAVSVHAQAPVAWPVSAGGNGNTYQAVLASVTWTEANAAAIAAGGHLATITSPEENSFVFSLIDSDPFWTDFGGACCSWGPWIGGFQEDGPEPDGGWRWVTDEPFTYTNWQPGEPNNQTGFGSEDHLHFFTSPSGTRDSTWNDFFNTPTFPLNGYVVEYAIPEPSSLILAFAAVLGILVGSASGSAVSHASGSFRSSYRRAPYAQACFGRKGVSLWNSKIRSLD